MAKLTTKQLALATISDLVADFLYYGRKEDEDLPRGEIDRLVREGKLTVEEMAEEFAKELRKGLT